MEAMTSSLKPQAGAALHLEQDGVGEDVVARDGQQVRNGVDDRAEAAGHQENVRAARLQARHQLRDACRMHACMPDIQRHKELLLRSFGWSARRVGGGHSSHLTPGAHRRERPQLCYQRQPAWNTFQTKENVDFGTLLAVLAAGLATTGMCKPPKVHRPLKALYNIQGSRGSHSSLLACSHILSSFPHCQRRRENTWRQRAPRSAVSFACEHPRMSVHCPY